MKASISLVAILVMLCACIAPSADVEGDVETHWNGDVATKYDSGSGTAEDPYIIKTAGELAFLAKSVNDGKDCANEYFILGSDIDISGKQWVPIGSYAEESTTNKPFKGCFDGKDHTISGLTTKIDPVNNKGSVGYKFFGLFGYVSGTTNNKYTQSSDIWTNGVLDESNITESLYTAVVKNVELSNVDIDIDGGAVGSLIGMAENTYISDIDVTNGTLKAQKNSGGVVAYSCGSVIKNVNTGSGFTIGTSDAKHDSETRYTMAGIVGTFRERAGAIIDCTNNAKVSAELTSSTIAGVYGMTNVTVVAHNCINTGKVEVTKIYGDAALDVEAEGGKTFAVYQYAASGIAGLTQGTSDIIFSKCINRGEISNGITPVNGSQQKIGMLSGIVDYASGTTYQCRNEGSFSGNSIAVSGISGPQSGTVIIDGCASTGSVTGEHFYVSTLAGVISSNNSITYRNMSFTSQNEFTNSLPGLIYSGTSVTFDNLGSELDLSWSPNSPSNLKLTLDRSFEGKKFTIIGNNLQGMELTVNGQTDIALSGQFKTNVYIKGEPASISVGSTFNDTLRMTVSNSAITFTKSSSNALAVIGDNNSITVPKDVSVVNGDVAFSVEGKKNILTILGTTHENCTKGQSYRVGVTGDSNVIINGGTMKCPIILDGKDNEFRNLKKAIVSNVLIPGGSAYVVNEGTIGGEKTGEWHPITITGVGAVVTVHNYGTIKGYDISESSDDSTYILYTTGFRSFDWYNHDGSVVHQTNHLFCFAANNASWKGNGSNGNPIFNLYSSSNVFKKNDASAEWPAFSDDRVAYEFKQTKDISLDPKGGEATRDNLQLATYENLEINIDELKAPYWEGHAFQGWYCDGSRIQKVTSADVNKTIVAKWSVVRFSVVFDSNGGSTVDPMIVDYNECATEPADPTRNGYRFDGWYSDTALTIRYTFESKVTSDITLYAKWLKNPTVSFDSNGMGKAPDSQTVGYNSTATKPKDPSVSGYIFGGWFTDSACTDAFDFSTKITADITLYAKWTYSPPTPSHSHIWDSGTVTKEATCTQTGVKTFKCTGCGQTRTESIPAAGHVWDSGTVTVQPTEKTEGVKTFRCTKCDETKTESIPMISCIHAWDSGKISKEATCGSEGVMKYTCTKCGETKTGSIPATGDHAWDSGTVIKEATSTESGLVEYKCRSCGQYKTATVEPKKTDVKEEDGAKVTTDVEKVTEKGDDGTVTIIEIETVITEKDGKKTESTTISIDSEGNVKTKATVTVDRNGNIVTTIAGDVSDDSIKEAVRQGKEAAGRISDITSDVSKNISISDDSVTLSPSSLDAIARSGASLTITGDAGTMEIDKDVSESMKKHDSSITLSINEKKSGLTQAQKDTAGDSKVIELSARSSTQDIHELGGKARIMIDMRGMEFENPGVFWLKDDGTSASVDAEFRDGWAVIELEHFSLYYIAEKEESDSGNAAIYIAVAIVIIAIVAAAGFLVYKNKTH